MPVAELLCLEFSVSGVYRVSIEEAHDGIASHHNIARVTCVNSLGYPVTTARYNITDGNSGPFDVDRLNGSIFVKEGQTIDYDEGSDFYTFTVRCVDLADPGMNSDAVVVNATIIPVNEFLPELSMSTITVNVSETLKVGTTLVSTVQPSLDIFTATDRDRGQHGLLHFYISRIDPELRSLFELNSTTGALVVRESLDVEDNLDLIDPDFAFIFMQITVCDRVNSTEENRCPNLIVQIRVDAVNEFDPEFSQRVYRTSVLESASVGRSVAEVNCTDHDKGRGGFESIKLNDEGITHSENVSFALDGNTVFLVQSLDFETDRVQNISLTCLDDDGRNATASLFVDMVAVNEHAPNFDKNLYNFTVDRMSGVGTEIGRVVAIDSDKGLGGNVSYGLEEFEGEETKSNFGVRQDGTVYLSCYIYAVEGDSFTFHVVATDGDFNDTAQVHVAVLGFLNVIEIAVLATGIVILLIIFCLSLAVFIYRKR